MSKLDVIKGHRESNYNKNKKDEPKKESSVVEVKKTSNITPKKAAKRGPKPKTDKPIEVKKEKRGVGRPPMTGERRLPRDITCVDSIWNEFYSRYGNGSSRRIEALMDMDNKKQIKGAI